MNKFTVEEINFMCVFETQNRMKMMEAIFQITSSRDLRPRLRTFIISSSDLLIRSSTVLIPARLRQLNERTERSSSSIVISRTFSLPLSSFSTIISALLPLSERSTKRLRWSVRTLAASETASCALITPLVHTSRVSLSKSMLWPTRVL